MPSRPVRIVSGCPCDNSMPVRIVTDGGSPVRIVTHGGDPVRIVTRGISDPVRVIGGGLAPDAPTFVSGEVGTVNASTVVVTFSTDISAPCGDCALGFTVLVNGVANAITGCVIVGGNTVQLTLTNPVVFGDVVTVSYDSAVGCIMEATGATDLATFGAQGVTNNVAAVIPWYLSGGILAANCLAAYTSKGSANLAASYDNNAAPGNGLPDGTYDAAPGVAPTWDVVSGWKFNGASPGGQYLATGIFPNSGWSMLIRFSNITVEGNMIGVYESINQRFSVYPSHTGTNSVYYYNGGILGVAPKMSSGVAGVAGQQGYRNGIADGGAIGAWVGGASTRQVYIGCWNSVIVGGPWDFAGVYIQAIAIWNTTITAPQVAAVSAAMAAL